MNRVKKTVIWVLIATVVIGFASCTLSYNTATISIINNAPFPIVYKGFWKDSITGDPSADVMIKILYPKRANLQNGETDSFYMTWLPRDNSIDISFAWGRWYDDGDGTIDVYNYMIDPFFTIKAGDNKLLRIDNTSDYDLTDD